MAVQRKHIAFSYNPKDENAAQAMAFLADVPRRKRSAILWAGFAAWLRGEACQSALLQEAAEAEIDEATLDELFDAL